MDNKNRSNTSPKLGLRRKEKHVTLQNYVIEFIEQQAQRNNKSFSSQLNSIVRMFKQQYDL